MAEIRRRKEGEPLSEDPATQSDQKSGSGAETTSDHVSILFISSKLNRFPPNS